MIKVNKTDFTQKAIKLRVEENEICIYATTVGLKKLIGLCETLLDSPKKGHIHLEDYELLTEDSPNVVIEVVESKKF